MNNKPILVVFTGGTIGSLAGGGLIDVDESTNYMLIDLYRKQPDAASVEFESAEPFSLLSEKIVPEDWSRLVRFIQDRDLSRYAGIIVTHGTDTLPFTAAALGFCFRGLAIPLVLAAANAPLNSPRSNGLKNFTDAVFFILKEKIPGVYVAYSNEKIKTQIHIGTRLRRAAPFVHGFTSERGAPLGFIKDGVFFHEKKFNPPLQELRNCEKRNQQMPPSFSSEIMYIRPHPGLNYQYLTAAKPKAILHDLYHSGTACTRDGGFSVLNLITSCRERGIDFYITPLESSKRELYTSTHALIENGAIPIHDMAVEAALVKIMLVHGQGFNNKEIQRIVLNENLFFERMIEK